MSKLLMQRRHSVLKGGERQPLLIHEWKAASYIPEEQVIRDTGAWNTHDGGNFEFIATSDTNFTIIDDYICFDGTGESVFYLGESSIAALDLGKSMVVELEWMVETLTSGNQHYLADFGSLCVINDGMCAFAIQQHYKLVGFNPKFYSNTWSANNGITTIVYSMSTYTKYTVRLEWFNDGDTITMNYVVNGEVQKEHTFTEYTDLSWNRFDSSRPVYIGRSLVDNFHPNKVWRFYALRIYNYD